MNPEADEAAYAIGFAREKQGRFPEATSAYAQALRIDPRNARARGDFGRLLLSLGRFDEGFAQLREAVRLDPDLLDAHYHLGRALQSIGRLDEARRHLSIAYRNLPEAERQSRMDAILKFSRPRGRDSLMESKRPP